MKNEMTFKMRKKAIKNRINIVFVSDLGKRERRRMRKDKVERGREREREREAEEKRLGNQGVG